MTEAEYGDGISPFRAYQKGHRNTLENIRKKKGGESDSIQNSSIERRC